GIPSAAAVVIRGRHVSGVKKFALPIFLGIRQSDSVLVADFEEGPSGPGPLGQNHPVIGGTAVTSNVWHHAAATYNGSTWKLYLDGAEDATLTLSGSPTPRFDSIQHARAAARTNSTGASLRVFAASADE